MMMWEGFQPRCWWEGFKSRYLWNGLQSRCILAGQGIEAEASPTRCAGRRAVWFAAALLLAGCHVTRAPDFSYFRLPRPAEPVVAPAPVFEVPVVVDAFAADGLYADQSLVYATDSDAHELRQYHYQLWVDPPTRLLQRRLIVQLRRAKVAALVTDSLPASRPALRVGGVILRLDRVPQMAGGYEVAVVLKLRADRADGSPLIDELYATHEVAADARLASTVEAYGIAIDRLLAEFQADLLARGSADHAR